MPPLNGERVKGVGETPGSRVVKKADKARTGNGLESFARRLSERAWGWLQEQIPERMGGPWLHWGPGL